MRPRNHLHARAQIRVLLEKRVTRVSPARKKELLRAYETIAEVIWRRWQVGIHQIRLKHLRWYLEHHLAGLAPGTRYRHWLRVAEIIHFLDKDEDWRPLLRGPWLTPGGIKGDHTNKGRKPKFRPK